MSMIELVKEGSIGALPKRLLVAEDHRAQARRLLTDAGLSVAE